MTLKNMVIDIVCWIVNGEIGSPSDVSRIDLYGDRSLDMSVVKSWR